MTAIDILRLSTDIGYLLGAICFIVGLRKLSSPKSAVNGNLLGAFGMLLALASALVDAILQSGMLAGPSASLLAGGDDFFIWLLAALVLGSLVGVLLAKLVDFKSMPQLVGLFNGFGGLASVLVAGAMLVILAGRNSQESPVSAVATAATALVGSITFWGSLVAAGKLQGFVTEKPVRYPSEQIVKGLVTLAALFSAALYISPELLGGLITQSTAFILVVATGSVLGLLLTLPIGGADMPIVIALLNSYSGIAAAATGFVLDPPNRILIIAGALVGASGIILTRLMCHAMNRSLANVLFGGVGAVVTQEEGGDIYAGLVKSTGAEEVAELLHIAQRVVIVPGYGMAVGRAATPVRQLFEAMEAAGTTVEFGIHPVAGRMPGHMNVLLAEENIPYDKLKEMDEINGSFANTDVVIVIGANDVVNPLAREDQGSPISGMPILDVDAARTVIVVKRSLAPGFAGISNPLFIAENCLMFFSDAKLGIEAVLKAYKDA